MSDSLRDFPLSHAVKARLQNSLWERCQPVLNNTHNLSSYFGFYSTRSQRFLRDGGIHVFIKTHSELINIAEKILFDLTKDELRGVDHAVTTTNITPSPITINNTVELCASLLVMAEIGVHEHGFSGSNPMPWPGQQTLRQALYQHFHEERNLQPDKQRLEKLFTAQNLVRIGGMRIKWTTNLVDHLLLTDDDQAVFIFHHAEFLRFQQSFTNKLFPDGLSEETLRTLSLLFPQNDNKSRRWIQELVSVSCIDPGISRCGSLRAHERRFENFSFWHDRLVVLKQAFDDSSPHTLMQWWNDRRNSVQWYTFWIAILVFIFTFCFGVIQCVEGGIQIFLARNASQESSG